MNVKLLREIEKHISEEPKRLVMGCFVQRKTQDNPVVKEFAHANGIAKHDFPVCGTAACIGGWACLLTNGIEADFGGDMAQDILELGGSWAGGEGEAYRLMEPCAWPAPFRDDYSHATTPEMRAEIAVRRIEHFIKTKGAE